jgi:hypothetical protein
VSPALILSTPIKKGAVGCAAVAGAACVVVADGFGVSSAQAALIFNVNTATQANNGSLFIISPIALNGARAALTRSDTHDLREIENKDFSIPYLSGFR